MERNKWLPIYKRFFESGEDRMEMHIEDKKTRNNIVSSVSNYILNHDLDSEYCAYSLRGKNTVVIERFGNGNA